MGEARRGVQTSPEEGRGRLRGGQRFPDGAWSLARWEASVLLLPAHKPTPALLSLAVGVVVSFIVSCSPSPFSFSSFSWPHARPSLVSRGLKAQALRLLGEGVCCTRDEVHVLPVSGTS